MATVDNFKDFSSIRIAANPVNTFAGLAIYGASLAINPGSPTKLTVRCVEGQLAGTVIPKGTFPASITSVSTNVSDITYPIWIGPLKLPEMYLISKESSTGSSQRVMTLTFVDKSILLDKIYVGLIGQHASYNDLPLSHRFDTSDPTITWNDVKELYAVNNLGAPQGWLASYASPTDESYYDAVRGQFRLKNGLGVPITTKAVKFPLSLNCEPCYDEVNSARYWNRFPNMRSIAGSVMRLIDYGRIVKVNHYYGGKIILGVDQFTAKHSDLPETDYNFTELLTALAEAGLLPLDLSPNKILWRQLGWIDKNPQYRVKHVGTLRNVLDNFAAEFGFMYFWDFGYRSDSRVALKAIDLTMTSQIDSAMNTIKTLVYNPPDGVGFDSIDESESMEGTRNIWYQGVYRKPSRPKTYQRRVQYRKVYENIQPSDIFSQRYRGGNRSSEEFDISCALAKYNKAARTIYNFYHLAPSFRANASLEHLGLYVIEEVSESELRLLINQDFNVSQFLKVLDNYNVTNGVKGYICVHSRELEGKWESWEAQVAEMYGKYYVSEDVNSYDNLCGVTEKWEKEIQHDPDGVKIVKGETRKVPFLNVIEGHPNGREISSSLIDDMWDRYSTAENDFLIATRNSAWGTDQGQFDTAFIHSGVNYLEKLVPPYVSVQGTLLNRFYDRVKEVKGSAATRINNQISQRDADADVVLVVLADNNMAKAALNIGDSTNCDHRATAKAPYKFDDGVYFDADTWNVTSMYEPAGTTDHMWWNNPKEYQEVDERSKHQICKPTFYERDYVKEACECPVDYGRIPTGAQVPIPVRTELAEEPLAANLAPRDGIDFSSFTAPWLDWGPRDRTQAQLKTAINAGASMEYRNTAGQTVATDVKIEDYYAPFMRDKHQEEDYKKYGTNDWYLADRENSWLSRHQIHHTRGVRIYTRTPGVTGIRGDSTFQDSPVINGRAYRQYPVVQSTSSVGVDGWENVLSPFDTVYHPTGKAFIGEPTCVDLIWPSENWLLGVRNESVTYTKTMPGTKQVRGDLATVKIGASEVIVGAGPAASIEINSIDLTQDFDSVSNPEGDGIIQATVPSNPLIGPEAEGYNLSQISLDDYWQRLSANNRANITVTLPQRTLSFRQFGTNATLLGFLSPVYGLTNMNLTLDQDGSYMDFSFSNRPAKLPSVDALKNKIGPALNMNTLR